MSLKKGPIKRAILVVSAVTVAVASLYYSFHVSLNRQKAVFEADAREVASAFRSAMDVVNGITSSTVSYKSIQADRQRVFAQSLLNNYEFVRGFGWFDSVAAETVAEYSRMIERALPESGPAVWWQDTVGNKVTHGLSGGVPMPGSRSYYPVIHALWSSPSDDKQDPKPLAGFDLGATNSLLKAIKTAAESARTTIVAAPSLAPFDSAVLAVRAQYDTITAPDKVRDRYARMDGGYFLVFDFDKLDVSSELLEKVGISLSLITGENEYTMNDAITLHQRDMPASELLLSDWFVSHDWLNSFVVGNQTFTLRISQQRGMTLAALSSWLLLALAMIVLLSVIAALSAKHRKAVKLQQQQGEALFREQQRAAVTLSCIGDGVISTDASGSIRYVNKAAEELLEIESGSVVGLPINSVFRLPEGERRSDTNANARIDGSYYLGEKTLHCNRDLLRVDGSAVVVGETVSPVLNTDGSRNGSVVVLRDITAEKELTKKLEHQVNHDSLTGLANRHHFESRLNSLFERDEVSETGHAVCMIDLDRFKEVNDTCGHAAGDKLLVDLADAISSRVRTEDLVARLGGDEFGIIIDSCDLDAATGVANRIHRFFNGFHFDYEDHVFAVRGSIGLVHFHPDGSDPDSIVRTADSACYQVKSNGRNSVQVCLAEEIDQLDAVGEELWLPRIERAIEHGDFVLYVQPVCALAKDCGISVAQHHELFIRMLDSENPNKLYYPLQFMKSAQRYGMMDEIDRWVVRSAIEAISILPSNHSQDLFSINLSAVSLRSNEFVEYVAKTLAAHGVSGRRLCFEITEEAVLNNLDAVTSTVGGLKGLGCQIALDDFGSGMSSLSSLQVLSVDYLKVDGQTISSKDHTTVDVSMVRSIHRFSKGMGLITIAERVESMQACKLLASIGVEYVQGYVVAEPRPLDGYFASQPLAA